MEAYALNVRAELGIAVNAPFDPYRLFYEHGVPVYGLEVLADYGCSSEAIKHFTQTRPEVWSAALVPYGSARFVIENTVHERLRRRSNVTHEAAHLLLEHEFEHILWTNDGCRRTNPKIEKEATFFCGELLIPKKAAINAAFAGRSNEQVAQTFEVSERFAQWRMDASGARMIVHRSRARR